VQRLMDAVDHFFCSLAADQRRRACGILLSVQAATVPWGFRRSRPRGPDAGRRPGGAEFPQMPPSAIDADVLDALLPAESMAEAILAWADRVIADTRNEPSESPEFDAHLRTILDILRAKVGHDFRCYKPNTLVRRIRRRMTMGKISSFPTMPASCTRTPMRSGFCKKTCSSG